MANQGFHLTNSRTKSAIEPGVLMENHKNITSEKKRKQISSSQDWFCDSKRTTMRQRHKNEALTHWLYWFKRLRKCSIQFPRDLRVAGASLRQMLGIWPLNSARATSSSSLLIPTSPARAWEKEKQYCGKYVMHQETPITLRVKKQMYKLAIHYAN